MNGQTRRAGQGLDETGETRVVAHCHGTVTESR